MRYKIVKSPNPYFMAYCGASSDFKVMDFEHLEKAQEAKVELQNREKADWTIYDTIHRKVVE